MLLFSCFLIWPRLLPYPINLTLLDSKLFHCLLFFLFGCGCVDTTWLFFTLHRLHFTWVAFSLFNQLLAGPLIIWCRDLGCPEWNDCRENANCRGLTKPGGISLNHLHVVILNNIDGDNFLDFFLLPFGRQRAGKLDFFSCSQCFGFDVFGTAVICPF